MSDYIFGAFDVCNVLTVLNSELAAGGSRVVLTDVVNHSHNEVQCVTARGGLYTAILWGGHSRMGVRSILRIKNKRAGYTYLPNGQPVKNCETVIFNGEGGDVARVGKSVCERYFELMYRHADPKESRRKVEERLEHEYR